MRRTEAKPNPWETVVLAGLMIAVAAIPSIFAPWLYDDFAAPKQATLLIACALAILGLAGTGSLLPENRPVRLAFNLALLLTVVAWASGVDPRGSLIGWYQYRQGLVTQAAYLVLFSASVRVSRRGLPRPLAIAATAGSGAAFVYTAVQALGADPIDWWVDTGDRAIGTLGNANELSALALVSLALLPRRFGGGRRRLWVGAVAAAAVFMILESESRSGLLGLGVFAVLLPLTCAAQRAGRRNFRDAAVPLAAGALAGIVLSLAAGGAAGSADRVQTSTRTADTGGSTRFALWEGTLAAVRADIFTGQGPDGLALVFPIERPADLGGAFDDYDLVVQSSHNWPLDLAANSGLLGLAAISALLMVCLRGLVKELPDDAERAGAATAWAALGGYGVLTALNPLSLAAHAIFWVALGSLVGPWATRAGPANRRLSTVPPILRTAAVAPAAAALVTIGVVTVLADRAANEAWEAYATGRFARAADLAGSAAQRAPWERRYATFQTEANLAAFTASRDQADLRAAVRNLGQLDEQFSLTSGDAFNLATALIGLREDPNRIGMAIDRAVALNPHGVAVNEYADRLRQAAIAGGELRYDERDRWVVVELRP